MANPEDILPENPSIEGDSKQEVFTAEELHNIICSKYPWARTVSEADKTRWKDLYIKLRKKWGEEILLKPSIRMFSHGIKTWHRKI